MESRVPEQEADRPGRTAGSTAAHRLRKPAGVLRRQHRPVRGPAHARSGSRTVARRPDRPARTRSNRSSTSHSQRRDFDVQVRHASPCPAPAVDGCRAGSWLPRPSTPRRLARTRSRTRSSTTRTSASTTVTAATSSSSSTSTSSGDVTTWPDREIRHVRYEGHFYNASDTSKSIVRNGDFALTFRFDATGGSSRADLDRAVRIRRGRGTPVADDRWAIDDGLRVRPADCAHHAACIDGDAGVRL